MTLKPIKIPSCIAALFFAGAALAGGGPFPVPDRGQEKAVRTDPSPCETGEAYTCKIQCGPTTRTFFERWTNNAGVEACVNLGCICERQVAAVNPFDPTQPTVFVIFGVRQLLPELPQ